MIIGEFEGPQSSAIKINLHSMTAVIRHAAPEATCLSPGRVEKGSRASQVDSGSVNMHVHVCVP
jgi:hypothetical protein